MHASYGKNGLFGLQNFSSRTLSADDIAAVRAIYGVRGESDDCCGTIEGSLTLPGKQQRNFEVWIEDANGRVQASKNISDSTFNFAGVNAGDYRVFAQETGKSKIALPVRELGNVTVANGETATVTSKNVATIRDFDLTYLGLNGQLSEMAISLAPGRSYTIYLGGRNLDPKKLTLHFTTRFISVVPGSMRSLDYGDDISVVSVEVRIAPRAPKGDYTIYAESDRGDRRAIIGGLTIDNSTNPYSGFASLE